MPCPTAPSPTTRSRGKSSTTPSTTASLAAMRIPTRPGPATLCLLQIVLILSMHRPSDAANCTRPSTASEKPTFPKHACAVSVTVTRTANCSLLIREEIIFPHMTSGFYRAIPALPEQNVVNVSATRDGASTAVSLRQRTGEYQRVYVRTVRTEDPVEYAVQYVLQGGVMRGADDACGTVEGGVGDDVNVLRWVSGQWDLSFDTLVVRFRTRNKDAKLKLLGDMYEAEAASARNVTVALKDVKKNVELYVEERGRQLCQVPFTCFEDHETPLLAIWIWIVLGVAAGFVVCLICCVLQRLYKCCSSYGDKGGYSGSAAGVRYEPSDSADAEREAQRRDDYQRYAFAEEEKRKRRAERDRRQRAQRDQQQRLLNAQILQQQRNREDAQRRRQRNSPWA